MVSMCTSCGERTPATRIKAPPPGDPICWVCYTRLSMLADNLVEDSRGE